MNPRFKPLAALPALALTAALAQAQTQLDTAVVTATHFAEKVPAAAGNYPGDKRSFLVSVRSDFK